MNLRKTNGIEIERDESVTECDIRIGSEGQATSERIRVSGSSIDKI